MIANLLPVLSKMLSPQIPNDMGGVRALRQPVRQLENAGPVSEGVESMKGRGEGGGGSDGVRERTERSSI